MRWAIKHKSGRTLFMTSDEFIANNRRKMGWIVEEVKMTSREQFEKWVKEETGFDLWRTEYPMTEWDNQQYKCHQTNLAWLAWQASRAVIEIELPNQFPGEYYLDRDVIYADELIEELEQAGLKVKK
nr:MAG TPA: hypothetical protein [Caudoviricetes sp.]